MLEKAKQKLFSFREKRVRPGPRREGARLVERARDPRHGARGRVFAVPSGSPRRGARSGFIRSKMWADRPARRDLQRPARDLNAYLDDTLS